MDNPEADTVSAAGPQRVNTMGSAAGRSAVGLSRRRDSEMQMEGGGEEGQGPEPAGQEADGAEPTPAGAAKGDDGPE